MGVGDLELGLLTPVVDENLYQHAEHYFRMMREQNRLMPPKAHEGGGNAGF
jgi:uncharacterized protein DUF4167